MSAVASTMVREVLGYLADRNRTQGGCWISVADVSGALGYDWSEAQEACRSLGDDDLAEFMGGFPLKLTREEFTLARLTERGAELADDTARMNERFGSSN